MHACMSKSTKLKNPGIVWDTRQPLLIITKFNTWYIAKRIASAIKVNVATAMPRENETKLALFPSVTLITVVVFLSTVKLLYPSY